MAEDPTTWTALKASIRAWVDSDSGGISDDQIEECIALAERDFNRDLRVPEMETTATITLDQPTESLPNDYLQLRAIYINADPKAVLEEMSLAELRNAYLASFTGRPQNFAIQGGNTLVFGPSPDASYSLIINYYQTITPLNAGTATNWLLTAHPDLYLSMSLALVFAYRMDEQRGALWGARAEGIKAQLRQQGVRKTWGSAPIRIRAPQVI